MKTTFGVRIATAAAAALAVAGSLFPLPARATTFGQTEVDRRDFIAVAAPVGTARHQLLVLEQISDARPCWRESGSAPVRVDPLLLNFDFTGICGRATDSNGFSVRVNGRDLGTQYSLRVFRENNDLVLKAVPFGSSNTTAIEIGRTHGVTSDFAKIHLNSNWRFTKRNYQGRTLGHIYLTSDRPLSALIDSASTTAPVATAPSPAPNPVPEYREPVTMAPEPRTDARSTSISEPVTVATSERGLPTTFDRDDLSNEQRAYLQLVWQRYEVIINNQRYAIEEAERQLAWTIENGASERTIQARQQNLDGLRQALDRLEARQRYAVESLLPAPQGRVVLGNR
ncbi:MAG: DUF3747 domain-containing protein [Cyanobacteria bacterium SID2]|nr:DUF3747 domain-containing protein [Cyanobacteria bacterium SID2]MBP0002190.1 DUF3747 domain-containing protein [Cyanobacteria bacterium SBC]